MCHSKQLAELAMLLVFPFLLLCYGVGNIRCSTIHENREDLRSLLDFQQGITDPNRALSNWNTSTHFCRWNGVNCSSTPPFRVTKLNLTGQSFGGQLSSSVGNLTFLQVLDLSNNNFGGTIPPLSNLQHLETLYLQSNLLHGVIPDALTNCSNLTYLDLSENQLTGVIPPSIGFLSKLTSFFLEENNLEGVIPATLGNITTLSNIDFTNDQLVGTIPDKFWPMPSLRFLYLGQNNLSGRIPQISSNTSSFEELSLAVNRLGGTLPSNMGNAFPNLQTLWLGQNSFTGPIPASLGNASSLRGIDLSENHFTSQIPSIFGNLLKLESLHLGGNMLEARDSGGWEFFHALRKCSNLDSLTLSNNQLLGSIPNSIADLPPSLTSLQMGGNQLSGIVPTSIGKLDGLIQLSLDYNNLTGTIEEWLGKLTNLQGLNLQSNNFTGTIPHSISNLKQLTEFSLAHNKFTGSLPPSLGYLVHLSMLNFSYNSFQGSIPAEFGNFRQLIILDLASNKLSGAIPETLGQLEQIYTTRMDQNILTGSIPITFSNLKTLTMLNLSHNNLSGLMPTSLNDLKSLTRLDISYNNFQGEIPTDGVFENATIVLLDGNPGLCGGALELHRPSCRIVFKRVTLVNYLIKILIPIFVFMSLVLGVYFLFIEKKRKRECTLVHSLGEHFQKVTYKDLALATQDFSESNLIGKGSYGSIYRGKLKESKIEVAVKVLNLEMRGAERSFMAECEALRSIQHRNLLSVITACSTIDTAGNDFKALLYELMPNGNLDTWLHHKGDEEARKRLGLTQRISIAFNLVDALNYLHHDCGRPTVHRDLKPSNILLADDMNALLGDFGIARFYVDAQSTWAGSISSIGVKGTIGYIPPEYGGGGHASTSGDVYSFGILLLEILTSKRPTDPMFVDGLDIISFVKNSFPDQIFQVIDAHLVEECKNLNRDKNVPETEINQCLVDLMQVALFCTRSLPSERANMKEVASKMHALKTSHLGWKYSK